MAVYTDVAADELAEFLSGYDIGELLSYKGIAEGVENSNFLLHTSAGTFILTLYEKRVARDDLPFFLSLMAHLASHGVSCPQPLVDRQGEALGTLAGRPATCLNAWCFESDHSFNVTKARAFLNAYGRVRKLSDAEQHALPLLARGAAMRFLLTRLVDFLNVPPGALVRPKDPAEYVRKLRFQQGVKTIRDYGVEQSGLVA